MAAVENLSDEDKEFISKCEEEFKDRFTANDIEFMKIFNAEPSIPPIVKPWFPQNAGRRNDRRNNRRYAPYDTHRDRDHGNRHYRDRRDNQDRRDSYDRRGYSDYGRGYDRRGGGYGNRHYRQ